MITPVMTLNGVSNFPSVSFAQTNRMFPEPPAGRSWCLRRSRPMLSPVRHGGLLRFADLAVLDEVVQPDEERRHSTNTRAPRTEPT